MPDWREEALKRAAGKTCGDCGKFKTPHWISDKDLGICGEDMFGHAEASDKNESACEYFKEKDQI